MITTDETIRVSGTDNTIRDRHWRHCLWRALLPVLVILTTGIHTGRAAAEIADSAIREAIQARFDADIAAPPDDIALQVEDGIVMLSGSVSNLLQKRQVRHIAESIRGVRSVVDNTRLTPLMRDDEAIAQDVRQRLRQGLNRQASGADIGVIVNSGVVTLSGTVDSWVLSHLISRRAMAVSGVREVENQLDVKPNLHRKDQAIRQDVMGRLDADLYVDARRIEVSVKDGRVALDGTVPTLAQKRRAEENAWIAGVVDVAAERLRVDWSASDRLTRQAPYVPKSDEAIKAAVEDALRMDPRVNSALPHVVVTNGAVTLFGIVDTLYGKRAAEADARNTTGVWNVDNQLRLRYRAFPPDEAVKRLIVEVLRRDAELHARDIDVTVEDNHVVLAGSVPTMGQKVRAENIVSQIEGVLTLANQIQVIGKQKRLSDAQISAAIKDELFWSPYVDSDQISVTVTDGQAVIRGRAANRFVARIAVQNAFEGGARSVRTRLALKDGSTVAEVFQEKPDTSPEEAARWLRL